MYSIFNLFGKCKHILLYLTFRSISYHRPVTMLSNLVIFHILTTTKAVDVTGRRAQLDLSVKAANSPILHWVQNVHGKCHAY